MNAVAFTTLTILLFVCGFVVGYVYKSVDDSEVMDADAHELAMLRQQVREMGERINELEEDGGDWSWADDPAYVGRVEDTLRNWGE